MKRQEKALEILRRLKERFPQAKTELEYNSEFQLLIAVILSAQCTDTRVNIVTAELFKKYPSALKLSKAPVKDIEEIIRSLGLYKSKAKNIIETSKALAASGVNGLPASREELEKLPGVGRKTANIILAEVFGEPTFAVDTHVRRVTRRLGLTAEEDVRKIEEDVINLIPERMRRAAHHYFIFLGRYICKAIKPECENCPLNELCAYFIKENTTKRRGKIKLNYI